MQSYCTLTRKRIFKTSFVFCEIHQHHRYHHNIDTKTYLLGVLLLIAKKMITVLWRNAKPPTVQQWRERLKSVYLMESITAKLQLRTDVFNIKWTLVRLQLPRLIKDTTSLYSQLRGGVRLVQSTCNWNHVYRRDCDSV